MKKFEFLWVSDYEPRDVITKIFASREEAKEFLRTLPGSSGAYGYWTFNEV